LRGVAELTVVGQDPAFGGGALAQMEAFLDAARALGREPELVYVPHPTFAGRRLTPDRIDALRQWRGGRRLTARLRQPLWVVAAAAPAGYAAARSGEPYSCWLGTSLADEWRGRDPGLGPARRAARAASAPFLRRLERSVLLGARRLYATGPWSRERIAEAARRDDVGILPLPVDPERFTPEPDEAWLRREPVLAFVGRADDPRKNVGLLLDAARLLPGVRVRLIGAPPARALPERVEATGPVSSVAEHLRTARLLVLPSWQEGFGIVAAEALACGVPVLAAPCGGPEALLRESGGGIVLAAHDARELAATAAALLDDVGTLSAMRRSGRDHVVREHSPARLRDLLADAID
jgi:glycosyltransferase involved in cell wall biosynthesis